MDALSVAWDTTNIATLAHCDAVRRGHPLHHRAFAKPRDGLTKDGTMILKLIDKAERTDGTFSRSDFAFDPESNLYVW
jgi:hypothetical protein